MSRHQIQLDAASASRLLVAVAPGPQEHALDPPDPTNALPAIPGYTIERAIGDGGGGTVYRAFRAGSECPIALKVMRLRLGEGPAAARAWRELDVLSSLRLACVPRVLDYGVHEGRLFIAAEFVDGLPADAFATTHALGTKARVRLLTSIAKAVQQLHEHGVIHRDLKPANVLVTPGGDVMVLDLGLAALADEPVAQTLTLEGQAVGTPAFMAPEQARGERHAINTRSDVYALGAIGYLLLTGATPHDTNTSLHEAIRRVAQDEPRGPRALDPTLPGPLGAVLGKACARDPARRYASAGALAADLDRRLRGEPVEATNPGAWVRSIRWLARHPKSAAAFCGIAAAGVVLLGGFAGLRWRYLNEAAYAEITSSEPWEVRISTRAGLALARWPSSRDANTHAGTALAVHLRRPPPWNDEVFATRAASDVSVAPFPDKFLCVWAKDDLTTPLWFAPGPTAPLRSFVPSDYPDVDGLATGRLPPMSAGDFRTTSAIVADVFPDRAGLEFVVAFACVQQPSVLRVLDPGGGVLFECLHIGSIGSVAWLAGPGLIIANASHGRRSWPALGYDTATSETRWPAAVFAIKPTLGLRADWILDGEDYDRRIDLRWYKLLAGEAVTVDGANLAVLRASNDARAADRAVTLRIFVGDAAERGDAVMEFEIDERGEIIRRIFGDPLDDLPAATQNRIRNNLWLVDRIPPGPNAPP